MIVLIDEMSYSETCAQTVGHFRIATRVTPRWLRKERFLGLPTIISKNRLWHSANEPRHLTRPRLRTEATTPLPRCRPTDRLAYLIPRVARIAAIQPHPSLSSSKRINASPVCHSSLITCDAPAFIRRDAFDWKWQRTTILQFALMRWTRRTTARLTESSGTQTMARVARWTWPRLSVSSSAASPETA